MARLFLRRKRPVAPSHRQVKSGQKGHAEHPVDVPPERTILNQDGNLDRFDAAADTYAGRPAKRAFGAAVGGIYGDRLAYHIHLDFVAKSDVTITKLAPVSTIKLPSTPLTLTLVRITLLLSWGKVSVPAA